MAFTELPEVNLSIKPLNLLDLFEIPWVNERVASAVQQLLVSNLVLPEQIELGYQAIFGIKPEKNIGPSALDFTTSEVRQEDIVRHHHEIEKSRREGGLRTRFSPFDVARISRIVARESLGGAEIIAGVHGR